MSCDGKGGCPCVLRVAGARVGVSDGAGLAQLDITTEPGVTEIHGLLVYTDAAGGYLANVRLEALGGGGAARRMPTWHVPPQDPGLLWLPLPVGSSRLIRVSFDTDPAANVSAFVYSFRNN